MPPTELLGGRPIKIADGTTVSMPDTPANQKAYPQQSGAEAGLGLSHPAAGGPDQSVLRRGAGRGHGAVSRQTDRRDGSVAAVVGPLETGDILLADAIFSNYWMIALLLERGVDLLGRHDGKRRVDFRQGRRLGRYDHVVPWHKPARPSWMSRKLYESLPQTLRIRETKVEVSQKGFRCRHLLLVTTLLDPQVYPPGRNWRRRFAAAGMRNWTCVRSST